MTTVGQMADICRSKNAGPYILTIDFLFKNKETYQKLKNSSTLNKEIIGGLYKVNPEQVEINYFDIVMAVKISMPRRRSNGSRYDTDVFGAQHHMPLMDLEFVE
jgi:hypothetical protein